MRFVRFTRHAGFVEFYQFDFCLRNNSIIIPKDIFVAIRAIKSLKLERMISIIRYSWSEGEKEDTYQLKTQILYSNQTLRK